MSRETNREDKKHFKYLLDLVMKYQTQHKSISKDRHASGFFKNVVARAGKIKQLYKKSKHEWVVYCKEHNQNPELFDGYLKLM